MLEIKANVFTQIKAYDPENPGLMKASIPIIWVNMPEIKANVPGHADQRVCYYRQMPETRTIYLESGPRCLNSRKMCTVKWAKML